MKLKIRELKDDFKLKAIQEETYYLEVTLIQILVCNNITISV